MLNSTDVYQVNTLGEGGSLWVWLIRCFLLLLLFDLNKCLLKDVLLRFESSDHMVKLGSFFSFYALTKRWQFFLYQLFKSGDFGEHREYTRRAGRTHNHTCQLLFLCLSFGASSDTAEIAKVNL